MTVTTGAADAMRERILGIEIEYCLTHVPAAGEIPMPSEQAAEMALAVAQEELGSPPKGSLYCANGAKLYHDLGHIEWASPECRGVLEALAYDKAGERCLEQIADATERRWHRQGGRGTLFVAKNNVDAHGHTFGSHENYLVRRTDALTGSADTFFDYLAIQLVPFLVSRTILCGNGYVDPRGRFQLSQRAPFITHALALDTRAERAILNTRDESHADPERHRRLHLILGDATMCEWATFLKLGTTSLVLEMIEDLFLDDPPELREPVAALHTIAGDPTLTATVRLRDGSARTALDIQQWYLAAAERFCAGRTLLDETALVLRSWREALELLARDSGAMVGRLDWVTKRACFPLAGVDGWGEPRLREFDFRYHSVRTRDSAFAQLESRGLIDTLVPRDAIDRAMTHPPRFTRARVRGEAIQCGHLAEGWTTVRSTLSNRVAYLMDPFAWLPPPSAGWLATDLTAAIAEGLLCSVPDIRLQALDALIPATVGAARVRALAAASLDDSDPRARARAVEVLGAAGMLSAGERRAACEDAHFLVRLQGMNSAAGFGQV